MFVCFWKAYLALAHSYLPLPPHHQEAVSRVPGYRTHHSVCLASVGLKLWNFEPTEIFYIVSLRYLITKRNINNLKTKNDQVEALLLKATSISHTAADELQATCSTDRSPPVLVSDWSQQLTWQPDAREVGGEGKSFRIWRWVLALTNHSAGNITKLSTVMVLVSYDCLPCYLYSRY